jgi:hypothetical protein
MLDISFIHTSTIICADREDRLLVGRLLTVDNEREAALQLLRRGLAREREENLEIIRREMDRLSNTEMVLYKGDNMTRYIEALPWSGWAARKKIGLLDTINMQDSVKFVYSYLEIVLRLNPANLPVDKLRVILEIFKNKEYITVLELFKHVNSLFVQDKVGCVKKAASIQEVLFEINPCLYTTAKVSFFKKAASVQEGFSDVKPGLSTIANKYRPLGEFGDITLNQIVERIQKYDWNIIINNSKVTTHAITTLIDLFSYGLFGKTYMKFIHNRAYDSKLKGLALQKQIAQRNRALMIFSIAGAPLTLALLRFSALGIKDFVDFSVLGYSIEDDKKNNVNESKMAIFLVLTKLCSKIPDWLKIVFKGLFLSLLGLKLLGICFTGSSSLNYLLLLKITYILAFLAIVFQILNLFLTHLFSIKKRKIPVVFPAFFINWLKEFEIISSSKVSIREFKKTCYIEILLYLGIIVVITFIFIFGGG